MPQPRAILLLILGSVAVLGATANDDFKAALFQAVKEDNVNAIKETLSNNPLKYSLINSIGPGGQTPLMHAVLTGKVDAVKVLLQLGADTSIGEKDGYTPLHGAGFQGRAEIAKELLEIGLDPLERHSDGYIPLHRACWGLEKRHTETVKVFLEKGKVAFDYKATNGKTCKEMTGNEGTLALLATYGSEEEEL